MRRVVTDMMYFSASVPSIPVQRQMGLADVVAARSAWLERPAWSALFAKAYALVAVEFPELRRAYLRYPWPYFYEYSASVAAIAIEREFEGEQGVFAIPIKDPAGQSLRQVSNFIRYAARGPIESIPPFARMVRLGGLPVPLRRILWWILLNNPRSRGNQVGTFALTTLSDLRTAIMHPRMLHGTLLTYGVIDDDGTVTVRVIFDHRVLDAATVGRALQRLEEVLNGPILEELRSGAH
jgi:hypothetical protein